MVVSVLTYEAQFLSRHVTSQKVTVKVNVSQNQDKLKSPIIAQMKSEEMVKLRLKGRCAKKSHFLGKVIQKITSSN